MSNLRKRRKRPRIWWIVRAADLQNLSSRAFAKKHRVNPATVRGARFRYLAPLPSVTDWSQVDWSLGNVEIARRIGVTRQRVHQKRKSIEDRD